MKQPKVYMKNLVLVLILSLLVVVGCGNKKDPTSGLQTAAVPPHNDTKRNQLLDVCPRIVQRPLIVAEGQSNTQPIAVVGYNLDMNSELYVSGGDKSIVIKPRTPAAGGLSYELTYSAPKGIIKTGSSLNIPISLALQSKTKPLTEDQLKACAEPMDIIIVRSNDVPVITKVSSLPKEIDLNSTTPIDVTVDIMGTGIFSSGDLAISYQFNKNSATAERPVTDLSQAITIKQKQEVKDGHYQIILRIDPQHVKFILRNEPNGKKELMTQLRVANLRNQFISPAKDVFVVANVNNPTAKAGAKK